MRAENEKIGRSVDIGQIFLGNEAEPAYLRIYPSLQRCCPQRFLVRSLASDEVDKSVPHCSRQGSESFEDGVMTFISVKPSNGREHYFASHIEFSPRPLAAFRGKPSVIHPQGNRQCSGSWGTAENQPPSVLTVGDYEAARIRIRFAATSSKACDAMTLWQA